MPVIGKNMISWFYAYRYVEHIEIKTKAVNIIHFPYLDLSQNAQNTSNLAGYLFIKAFF
jgi:hypothetical protein